MPSGLVLTFEGFGATQMASRLGIMAHQFEDAEPAWRNIADDFAQLEAQRFASGGPGWAALSPAYAAYKSHRYPGKGILVASGNLRDSLSHASSVVQGMSPTTLTLGSTVPYGKYHQHGTARMPARKPIDMQPDDRRRWLKILQTWATSVFGGAGIQRTSH